MELTYLFLLFFSFFVFSKYEVIGINTDSESQESGLVLIDGFSGKTIRRIETAISLYVDGTTLLKKQNVCTYFIAFDNELYKWDCETLKQIGEPVDLNFHPWHVASSQNYKELFGIRVEEDRNSIIKIDPTTGSVETHMEFSNDCGVFKGSQYYDEVNDLYFISCKNISDSKNSESDEFIGFSMDKKKEMQRYKVDFLLRNIGVKNGFMYGLANNALWKLNFNDGKYEKIVDYEFGIYSLLSGTISNDGKYYFASFMDYEKKYFVKFDLETKTFEEFEIQFKYKHISAFSFQNETQII